MLTNLKTSFNVWRHSDRNALARADVGISGLDALGIPRDTDYRMCVDIMQARAYKSTYNFGMRLRTYFQVASVDILYSTSIQSEKESRASTSGLPYYIQTEQNMLLHGCLNPSNP